MKSKYIAPTLLTIGFQSGKMIAASLPISTEDSDDEARSNAFWGETLFDESDNEDASLF